MTFFTRRDAINCRNEALGQGKIGSMLKETPILDNVASCLKFEIQSNPEKERYQHILYIWNSTKSGSMPESLQNQFQEALAKKYLPSFPDCEITHYKKDNCILFVMNLYMEETEAEEE